MQLKDKTKYVFVILVYKNTGDLDECLNSIEDKVQSYKAVVVNAYYDEETMQRAKEVAAKHHSDFINIENKGYSFGNNQGIEFATEHYDYEYIVVSNPDVVIEQFDDFLFSKDFGYDVIAPRITAASGRRQNPMSIRKIKLSEYLEYQGFKKNSNLLIYTGILISKILRIWFSLVQRLKGQKVYKIYGAHGSFVILSKYLISNIIPVYDENIFLFAEEGVLASKCEDAGLLTCYYDNIHIRHKEDGSMKLSDFSVNKELQKANIYYYEHYILKK